VQTLAPAELDQVRLPEALTNVAGTVALTLSYMGDVVSLDVRDDGVGIGGPPSASDGGGFGLTASASDGGGFGLTAMRQCVEGLSGSLAVESEPGGGTTIAASIPVIPAANVPAQVAPNPTPVHAQAQ
jgi:signal transduction histidine kinase